MIIVVSEYLTNDALELLGAHAELRYDPEWHAQPDALARALGDADALIARNQTQVTASLLSHANTLRVVGRVGVGVDNLDLVALKAKQVRVTYAPGTNAVSVAEYVLGAMLDVSRRYRQVSARVHAGQWDRKRSMGSELSGKTLGIVGLGDIGTRVAKRAAVFGMRLLAYAPSKHLSSFAVQEYGVTLVPFETLLAEADFVSLHAPLTPATKHLLNAEAFKRMKASAWLINTARGGLVDEGQLATALQAGELAGAVLDVRDPEPPEATSVLHGLDNVILTPHIAASTHESLSRMAVHVSQDVLRVLSHQPPVSPLVL